MNKIKASILLMSLSIMLVFPGAIGAVEVDKQLIPGLPSMYSTNEFIIAHESGNPNNVGPNSLYNEVAYMKRNWTDAFTTHWVGSGGKVIQIAPTGQVSWGAGSYANCRSYAQVELARTNDRATFEKDYKAYVELLKQLAKEANLPLTLDSSGKGIKSHEWFSNNLGGTDHKDPFSYLASWGITRAQFNKDLTSEPAIAPSVNKTGTLKLFSTMAIKSSADIKAPIYKKGDSFYCNKNGVYSEKGRYMTIRTNIGVKRFYMGLY